MKLHKNKPNELLITTIGNKINVQTKGDIALSELRNQQKTFLFQVLFLLSGGFILGMCVMYLIIHYVRF